MNLKNINERDLLQYSPEYFIYKVYGYYISEPHQKIIDHIQAFQETLDLAPRGLGKTRIVTVGWGTWKAVNNPDIRILIVSDTDGHATRFLNTIKTTLAQNELIKANYGDLKGAKWSDHELTLKTRSKIFTEATITALGMYSGAVTTGHYDILILDDLINFENSRTEGQRERAKTWYKTTLLPTLLTGGEIHVIGTRYHPTEIYQTIIDEFDFDIQIQRASIDEKSICEWLLPAKDKVVNGRKLKGLVTIKKELGSVIYNLQYQNDIELMKQGHIFKYNWFNFYDEIPGGLRVFIGIDPAISKKASADYFALAVIGIDGVGNVYVLDIFREKGLSLNDQVELINRKYKEWKPLIVGIEQVSYQEALKQAVTTKYSEIRVTGIITSKDKVTRAYSRSGLFENGKVFVRPDMHLFIDELVLFPDGENDDMWDAFDFAMTASDEVVEGTSVPVEMAVHPSSTIPDFGDFEGDSGMPGL